MERPWDIGLGGVGGEGPQRVTQLGIPVCVLQSYPRRPFEIDVEA